MDVYSWNARAHTDSICTENDIRVKRALPLIGQAGKILDLGCLDGTIGALLQRSGNQVSGIDASEPAVKKARQKGIEAKLGNLEEGIPFSDRIFDLIFAGEVLEHIFDIDHLLDEIFRVLKPSGELVLTTPNLAAFGRRLLLLFNKNPHIEISFTGTAAGHIRYFIRDTLFSLLRNHSFTPVYFTSDVINFNRQGTLRSYRLARLFPTLGRSLIVKARK